jgi:predicted  nucleic acid-binding Zn-ribbon protein
MGLERILQNVESGFFRVGQAFLKPSLKEGLRDEADRLSDELRQRHEALDQARAEQTATQRRIAENQNAIQVLTGHIQTCLSCGHGEPAWQFALQLDRLRDAIAADQARLPRLEQVCWSLRFQIRQMERQLARLHEKLYPS